MKQEEQKQRIRKAYSKRGTRTQKMMNFRLDNDLEMFLSTKPNKGRFINNLIRAKMEAEDY